MKIIPTYSSKWTENLSVSKRVITRANQKPRIGGCCKTEILPSDLETKLFWDLYEPACLGPSKICILEHQRHSDHVKGHSGHHRIQIKELFSQWQWCFHTLMHSTACTQKFHTYPRWAGNLSDHSRSEADKKSLVLATYLDRSLKIIQTSWLAGSCFKTTTSSQFQRNNL